jgi:hypothetical protein
VDGRELFSGAAAPGSTMDEGNRRGSGVDDREEHDMALRCWRADRAGDDARDFEDDKFGRDASLMGLEETDFGAVGAVALRAELQGEDARELGAALLTAAGLIETGFGAAAGGVADIDAPRADLHGEDVRELGAAVLTAVRLIGTGLGAAAGGAADVGTLRAELHGEVARDLGAAVLTSVRLIGTGLGAAAGGAADVDTLRAELHGEGVRELELHAAVGRASRGTTGCSRRRGRCSSEGVLPGTQRLASLCAVRALARGRPACNRSSTDRLASSGTASQPNLIRAGANVVCWEGRANYCNSRHKMQQYACFRT